MNAGPDERKEHLVVPRPNGQGGSQFDIYAIPEDIEAGRRLMSMSNSNLRRTKATKTVKTPQAVVNFVVNPVLLLEIKVKMKMTGF